MDMFLLLSYSGHSSSRDQVLSVQGLVAETLYTVALLGRIHIWNFQVFTGRIMGSFKNSPLMTSIEQRSLVPRLGGRSPCWLAFCPPIKSGISGCCNITVTRRKNIMSLEMRLARPVVTGTKILGGIEEGITCSSDLKHFEKCTFRGD